MYQNGDIMRSFYVNTSERIEVIDITEQVEHSLGEGGAVLLFLPHATAALSIGEYEPNIKSDYEVFLHSICPKLNYLHNNIDNNAEAHILSALIKPSLVVPVKDKKLLLGTWQRILLFELDGPRRRRVIVSML